MGKSKFTPDYSKATTPECKNFPQVELELNRYRFHGREIYYDAQHKRNLINKVLKRFCSGGLCGKCPRQRNNITSFVGVQPNFTKAEIEAAYEQKYKRKKKEKGQKEKA